MASRFVVQAVIARPVSLVGFLALAGLSLGWVAPAGLAKEPSLSAIELYDGPTGPAYVQLSDVLINGKAEMRDCTPVQGFAIDKPTYNRLEKVILSPGGTLERGRDGVLHYNSGHGPSVCVVPANVRFEHSGGYSLSDLADLAQLRGTPAVATSSVAPPIRPGVALVFVTAPNQELAEYLRAQRANDIAGWQDYLSHNPNAPHSGPAKLALAGLYTTAGAGYVAAYDKTVGTPAPSYSDLKSAKAQSDLAHPLITSMAAATKLDFAIRARLNAITQKGRDELDLYHAALSAKAPGYSHLLNAGKLSDIVAGIDANTPSGQALADDVAKYRSTFESALQSAAGAEKAKQFDQALIFIAPYRSFADEEPRVAAVVDDAYGYHLAHGNELSLASDWDGAIKEFQKADSIQDTAEARDSLKEAQTQQLASQDKDAAAAAEQSSKAFETQKDMIRAYEVLFNLPPAQRALVTADLDRLTPAYVQSSSQEAKGLRQAHTPIRGLADEIGIQKAYKYLEQAYKLSQNESYKDRMALLGDQLSIYRLEQAKHYFAKPAGSGTEMGWTYLTEALPYKASNLDAVRDAMVAASAAHSMRSRLSIRVQFRDQTSQRDSTGFAGQLENAIITGLEGSGVPVKVVRAGDTTAVEPDFQLAGDVLQHHLSVTPTVEPQDSKYLAGEKETVSEEWNRANRAYEKAEMELQTAQTALQGGEARGNKNEIKELGQAVAVAQKSVEDAHVLLDSTPKTVTTDVIRPYTYTKRTIDIGGVIQLQFRIGDSFSGQMADLVPTTKEEHKQYVVLENVKPEDTEGIKPSGTIPDSSEFLTALENSALDALVTAVRKKVEALPMKIYSGASSSETDGDLDSAAEAYIRFLNISKEDGSPERKHARQFLMEQFDMDTVSSKAP